MRRWIIQWAAQAYAEWFFKRYGKEIRDSADRESIRLYVWLFVLYHTMLVYMSQSLARPEANAEADHTAELEDELEEIAEVLSGFTPSHGIASRLNEMASAMSKASRIPQVPSLWSGMDLRQRHPEGLAMQGNFWSISKRMIEANRVPDLSSVSPGTTVVQQIAKYRELTNGIATAAGPFAKINERITAAAYPLKGLDTGITAALTKHALGSKWRTWMDFGAKPGADFFKGMNTGVASKVGITADWRELIGGKSGLGSFVPDEKALLGSASRHTSFLKSLNTGLDRRPWWSSTKQLDALNKEHALAMQPAHKQLAALNKEMADAYKGLIFPPRPFDK